MHSAFKLDQEKLVKLPHLHTRIAPTPSGYLHQGNLINITYIAILSKLYKIKLSLRIDDIDPNRSKLVYVEDILQKLGKLKIEYSSGPQTIKEFEKTYSKQLTLEKYKNIINSLNCTVYNCCCSRAQILKLSQDNIYQGTCRNLGLSFQKSKTAIRAHVNSSLFRQKGDQLIWTKDNTPSFLFSTLLDDIDDNINLIIRGEDLNEMTSLQKELSNYLPENTYDENYFLFHHLYKKNNVKISKSNLKTGPFDLNKGFYKEFSIFFNLPNNNANSIDEMVDLIANL